MNPQRNLPGCPRCLSSNHTSSRLKSSVNFKSWFDRLWNNLACVAGSFVGERANKPRSSILLTASPFARALPNKTASYAATNGSALACVFQNSRKRFASPKNCSDSVFCSYSLSFSTKTSTFILCKTSDNVLAIDSPSKQIKKYSLARELV